MKKRRPINDWPPPISSSDAHVPWKGLRAAFPEGKEVRHVVHGPDDKGWLIAGVKPHSLAAALPYRIQPILERAIAMAKVSAFHSIKPNTHNVYHDNDRCTEGTTSRHIIGVAAPLAARCVRIARASDIK